MTEVIVLVEGQTEENLVNQVLAPAVGDRVSLKACLNQGPQGGGSWKHDKSKLKGLLKAPYWRVGLLIDYYRYPKGAPGADAQGSAQQRQQAMVQQLHTEFPDPRFRPLVVMHEIEALVLAAIAAGQGKTVFGQKKARQLRDDIDEAGGPEQVNNLSHRLLAAAPKYLKTVNSPALVAEAGLDAVLQRCPLFAGWWRGLLEGAQQ